MSNRSTLSFSQSFRSYDSDGDDTQDFNSYDASRALLSTGQQVNSSSFNYTGLTSQVMFRHQSPKEGKEWTMDLTYNSGTRDNRSVQDLRTFDPDGAPIASSPRIQENLGGSEFDRFSFQADFIDPECHNEVRIRFEEQYAPGPHLPECVHHFPGDR
ncbi:MAG: hypothetical protein R2818_05090 [Flavobacteriales bacterium]